MGSVKKTLNNGRDRKATGGFSQVTTEMQRSAAFRSLSNSGIRLLLWCLWKNFAAATSRDSNTGNPKFRMTNAEARSELGMGSAMFSRAKDELASKGFLVWARRGGLKGSNGVASEFSLSGDWKKWIPPAKPKRKPPKKTAKAISVDCSSDTTEKTIAYG